jgi:Gpi18-like mannosyltransferase
MRNFTKGHLGLLYPTVIITFFLLCFFTVKTGFTADLDCWIRWSNFIKDFGLPYVYGSDCNYMPVMPYVFYLYSLTQDNVTGLTDHIYYLKYFVLLFDIIGAIVVSSFSENKKHRIFLFLLVALNIGYLYNTMIWGQFDAMQSTLLLLSLYFILTGKLTASSVFFTLAFLMKFISVIYFPALAILWFLELRRSSFKQPILKIILLNVCIIIISFIPFIYGMGLSHTFYKLAGSISNHSNVISKSAFNLWQLIISDPLFIVSDKTQFLIFSYKAWGTSLFLIGLGLILYPILKIIRYSYKGNFQALCFLIFSMVSMLFFYFKTGIHERYIHSALIFMAAYSISTFDFRPYILLSIAYFFQLNDIMISSGYYTFAPWYIDKDIISLLFLITIIYSSYRLFNLTTNKNYDTTLP